MYFVFGNYMKKNVKVRFNLFLVKKKLYFLIIINKIISRYYFVLF